MSPRRSPPDQRERLLDVSTRILAREGIGALTARRVSAECGVSTMAVYTAFGGMEPLQVALRTKAFRGLGDRLRSVSATTDPVADVAAMGLTYCSYALAEPHLYKATFFEERISGDDVAAGLDALTPLLETVAQCVEAGRFNGHPPALAAQLWATAHGAVSAHLAGLFGFALADPELTDGQFLRQVAEMTTPLFIGFGDDPRAAAAAKTRALRRLRLSRGLSSARTLG